jgi:hypothetical protein
LRNFFYLKNVHIQGNSLLNKNKCYQDAISLALGQKKTTESSFAVLDEAFKLLCWNYNHREPSNNDACTALFQWKNFGDKIFRQNIDFSLVKQEDFCEKVGNFITSLGHTLENRMQKFVQVSLELENISTKYNVF